MNNVVENIVYKHTTERKFYITSIGVSNSEYYKGQVCADLHFKYIVKKIFGIDVDHSDCLINFIPMIDDTKYKPEPLTDMDLILDINSKKLGTCKIRLSYNQITGDLKIRTLDGELNTDFFKRFVLNFSIETDYSTKNIYKE